MKRKILSVILMLCIILGSLCITPVQVKAVSIPSESAFVSKIKELQERFKHGEYWNKRNSADFSKTGKITCGLASVWDFDKNICGECENSWQCMGFAWKMANECFGISRYSNSWEKSWDLGTVHAGDVLRINKDTHSIFVYKVDGNKIYYADCNYTGHCQVQWGATMSYTELKSKFYYKQHLSGNNLTGTGTAKPAYTYTNISGTYYLKNLNNNKYLTVDGFADADKANLSTAEYSSQKQKITITNVGGNNHKLVPTCTSRLINAWGNNPTNGANVNLYHFDSSNASSQYWRFEKYSENTYIIHLAYDENLCLANSGTNAVVQNRTGYSSQIWVLESVPSAHNHNYKYQYFLASHPHYDQYICSCGTYKIDYNTAKYYDKCEKCKEQEFVDIPVVPNPDEPKPNPDNKPSNPITNGNQEMELGDINGDGKIDTKDARLALLAYVGKQKLTTEQIELADVNKDGKVDTKDARQILLYYVGKIKNF
ncbi:MAG: hypothetical protein HFJ52_02450 [Clostridia bacterium]|nr:hypothetical protein [Clostridia bacterium]